jgi:uncharacterized protein
VRSTINVINKEINIFFQNLSIITSYKKEFIAIDKSLPRIYRISKDIFSFPKDNSKLPHSIIKDYYNLKSWSYLPSRADIKQYNNENPAILSIRVTEDCNLRCRYCYNKDNLLKTGSKNFMPEELAEEAIRYFLSRFKNKNVIIIFFGGEPLLNFQTIKRAINYAQKIKERSITFKIATNGTIMNRDILKTIIKNNIKLTVSLDFPVSEHNKNRPFKNGNHSFEKIKKNLMFLIKKLPSENILIRTVVTKDSPFSLKHIYKNFYNSGIPTKNFVAEFDLKDKSNRYKFDEQKNYFLKSQRQYLISNKPTVLYKNELAGSSLYVIISGREPLEKCPAIDNAITVNFSGDMYFCHVVANKDEYYLGNIRNGPHEPKIKKLREKYIFKSRECDSCWASCYCSMSCPLSRQNSKSRQLDCGRIKKEFIDSLKFFLNLDYNQIQRLIQHTLLDTKDKNYTENQLSNLKICMEIYKMLNLNNKYIKPVNVIPY